MIWLSQNERVSKQSAKSVAMIWSKQVFLGVWQGVAMDPHKVSPRPFIPYTPMPCGWPTPSNGLTAVSEVAHWEEGWLVVVFYHFEYPTLYDCASFELINIEVRFSRYSEISSFCGFHTSSYTLLWYRVGDVAQLCRCLLLTTETCDSEK
jgi:hypothetical protein